MLDKNKKDIKKWNPDLKYDSLLDAIMAYSNSQVYPMHMPGHKRRTEKYGDILPFSLDMTESMNMADLHHAGGRLLDARRDLAKMRGAKISRFLAGGSTCGNLSGLKSICNKGDKILVARNCHQSIYHAIEILDLDPIYFLPMEVKDFNFYGSVDPNRVEELLEENPDCKALVITSPTYEGIISDVERISKIAHKHDCLLMVDQAHGAHLFFDPDIKDAVEAGADLVVESLHKTLPALTPAALIHASDKVDPSYLDHNISIFETTSPSHLVTASIDECLEYLKLHGFDEIKRLNSILRTLSIRFKGLKNFKFFDEDSYNYPGSPVFKHDPGKLVFEIPKEGPKISFWKKRLHEKGFIPEMCLGQIILAMSTIADEEADLLRFASAVFSLDEEFEDMKSDFSDAEAGPHSMDMDKDLGKIDIFPEHIPERIYPLSAYPLKGSKAMALEDCIGKVSAEYVFCYPPGIPIILPGEKIGPDIIRIIKCLDRMGQEIRSDNSDLPDFLTVLDH